MAKVWKSQSLLKLEQWIKEGKAILTDLSMNPDVLRCEPERLQARVRTDPEHVQRIANGMVARRTDGAQPTEPIVVFLIHGEHYVVDGHHRHGAHEKLRWPSILAYVIKGTWREAIEFSAGANLENSSPTTRDDRLKALEMLLTLPEHASTPIKELGDLVGLSPYTVRHARDMHFARRKKSAPPIEHDLWAGIDGEPPTTTVWKIRRHSPHLSGARLEEHIYGDGTVQCWFIMRRRRVAMGSDPEVALQKLPALAQAILNGRKAQVLPSPANFRRWLARMGVPAEMADRVGGLGATRTPDALLFLMTEDSRDHVLAGIGTLLMLQQETGFLGQLILIHPEEVSAATATILCRARALERPILDMTVTELARSLGVPEPPTQLANDDQQSSSLESMLVGSEHLSETI
jgi:hypothetical protein